MQTQEEKRGLIELFLHDRGERFGRGIYHDPLGGCHRLECQIHMGMFTDSCLIQVAEGPGWGVCACRYFPREDGVEFYDTLYNEQDYSTPMRIHNTGKTPLRVRFQFYDPVWTVPPGGSRELFPYRAEGADELPAE